MSSITLCMPTLNEVETIEETLNSASEIISEVVIIDGGSSDDTISKTKKWCQKEDKDLEIIYSSEREYLLEGVGTQRRRMEEKASNEYVLHLDADTVLEIEDKEWFEKELNLLAYSHTRVKPSGELEADFRLYSPEPPKEIRKAIPSNKIPRWRGMVHEEIRSEKGLHVSEIYQTGNAPMKVHEKRKGVTDTFGSRGGNFSHRNTIELGERSLKALKKQHYLLARAVNMDASARYLSNPYLGYYDENEKGILSDYVEIKEEYGLPEFIDINPSDLDQTENKKIYDDIDISKPESSMNPKRRSFLGFFLGKIKNL